MWSIIQMDYGDQIGGIGYGGSPPRPNQRLALLRVNSDQQQAGLLKKRKLKIGLDGADVKNENSRAKRPDVFDMNYWRWHDLPNVKIGISFQTGAHTLDEERVAVQDNSTLVFRHVLSISVFASFSTV